MATIVPARQPLTRVVPRFFRSPKGILLLVLGLMAGLATTAAGITHVGPNILIAMAAAAFTDLALMTVIRGERSFPSGALLTGLIVAMVLSEASPLYATALTASVAIGSKYAFRTRWSNVFNPAALSLVVAYFLFGSGESWWGAFPDLPVPAILLLVAAGLFIADRVNKIPMVLVFLGAFFGLATVTVFAGDPARVQELFRAPDVNAILFFSLFMLDDPPTSPVRYVDQMMFALLAAVVSYAVFTVVGAVYFLPAGLLIANGWETLRRIEERSGAKPSQSKSLRQSTRNLAA